MKTSATPAFLRTIWTPLALVVVLVVIALLVTMLGGRQLDRTMSEMLIRLMVVIGIYIFVGNTGIISFGHVGFMAIGAYAAAWQSCCEQLKPYTMPGLPDFLLYTTVPPIPTTIMSGLLAALVGLVFGAATMRLSGIAASICTFAFLAIVNVAFSNWDTVTNGTSSVVGIPTSVTTWSALAWCVVAIFFTWFYQTSRFGLALRSSREDVVAAQSIGVNIFIQRLISFVASAFFVGVGGALYAQLFGSITVNNFYLSTTFIVLAMLVVGGIGSLTGAVTGVLIITAIVELLKLTESGVQLGATVIALPPGTSEVGLGILMILILIFRNGGLTQNRELRWPFT